MLQLEDALNNLVEGARSLVNLHAAAVLADNRLLLRKVAHAAEDEVRTTGRNLHIQLLAQRIHVTANLLEVDRRHVDDAGEVEGRNLDILHIRVEQLEKVVRCRGLLTVLHADAQLVGIACGQVERE